MVYGLKILGVSKEKINSIMNTLHDSSERVSRMDKGKKGVCSIDKIYRIKKGLEQMVVSIKDKNKEQLYVECPKLYEQRLRQNTDDRTIFEEMKGVNKEQMLEVIKGKWKEGAMERFGGWLKGDLPYMYVIPKEKDPVNKTRLIA